MYGTLRNVTGIPGQNSGPSGTPSEKIFGNHRFIRYNGTCYDPSYGLIYTGEADFASKLVGYLARDPSDTTRTKYLLSLPVFGSTRIQFSLVRGTVMTPTTGCN